jgi:hypothetical protein
MKYYIAGFKLGVAIFFALYLGLIIVSCITQPVQASNETWVDCEGYIRGDTVTPARTPNSTSTVTKGYIYSPPTRTGHDSAQNGYVRLRSRTVGKHTITTGTIGNRTVRVVTEEKK